MLTCYHRPRLLNRIRELDGCSIDTGHCPSFPNLEHLEGLRLPLARILILAKVCTYSITSIQYHSNISKLAFCHDAASSLLGSPVSRSNVDRTREAYNYSTFRIIFLIIFSHSFQFLSLESADHHPRWPTSRTALPLTWPLSSSLKKALVPTQHLRCRFSLRSSIAS